MKKTLLYRSAAVVLFAVFWLAVFSPAAPVLTAAAEENSCAVHFEKEAEDGALVLTAVLAKYNNEVSGAVLALSFDPSKVSISEDDITVLSDGTMFSSKVDHENGNVSVECAYFSGLSDNTPLASFRFTLNGGVTADSIDQSVIRPCEDNEFLSALSPNYAWSGGVYLTNGTESFSASKGVELEFDIPPAPDDEPVPDGTDKTGSCSRTGSTAAIIAGAVVVIAAGLFLFRKGRKK